VLGRGFSEEFLVIRWRRSNRPPIPGLSVGSRVVSDVVFVQESRLLVLFVPRTSSTPMATWFWQTEGRSVERVISGVRPGEFILLEFQSSSRKIFIGSHSLPPLSFAVSVLQLVSEPVRVFIDSSQSKIQRWRTRNWVRVLHTSMGRTNRCGVSVWRRSSAESVKSFGISRWTQVMSSR
jgi:hypothetical protein